MSFSKSSLGMVVLIVSACGTEVPPITEPAQVVTAPTPAPTPTPAPPAPAPAPAPTPTADDHADSGANGTALTIGQSQAGSIEQAGDRDFFRVTLTAGTRYTIRVTGQDGASLFVFVTKPSGTSQGSAFSNSSQVAETTFTADQSGTYVIEVSAGNGQTGRYSLTALSN